MLQSIKNIYNLGVKELRGVFRDYFLLGLIAYSFTLNVFTTASAAVDNINKAAVAVVDEDHSHLSKRLIDGLLPPYFDTPVMIERPEIDPGMDKGTFTFVIVIPNDFQSDVEHGMKPVIQLNVDATRMSQAFTGDSYIQQIFDQEVDRFEKENGKAKREAINVIRNRFNPNLTATWFEVIMQLMNNITMLAIILTGSALIRERERGTLEHLMVMPVTPFEIMTSKIWSMALLVLIASALSIYFVIHCALGIPLHGNFLEFILGMALHMFAVTSMGIFLACVAQSMPQLGMLLILVLMPMQILSGASTPQENMPEFVRNVMHLSPTTHMVGIAQGILCRGGRISDVISSFIWLFGLGSVTFVGSLIKFRKSLS